MQIYTQVIFIVIRSEIHCTATIHKYHSKCSTVYDYFLKNVAKFKHVLDTYWIKTVQCIFLGFYTSKKVLRNMAKKYVQGERGVWFEIVFKFHEIIVLNLNVWAAA